ncbi:MAG: transcriptional repressor LexA [Streptosporangiaceae bacterium]
MSNHDESSYSDIEQASTQQLLLTKILEASPDGQRPPTNRELTINIGMSAVSNINRALDELERKGYIERTKIDERSLPRALKLTRRALAWLESREFDTSRYIEDDTMSYLVQAVPVLGGVAAGNFISTDGYIAKELIDDHVPLPTDRLPLGTIFILNVEGESMRGDGIFDGDQVIVAAYQQPKATGEIVVALLNNDVTIKRLRRVGESYLLEPSNPRYEAREVSQDEDSFLVLGKVVGLIRWQVI